MKTYQLAIATFMLGSIACAHPPRPYRFSMADHRDDLDAVVQTLQKNGLEADIVDRQHRTVTTRWKDTGYRFREVDDGRDLERETDIFLRYRVSLASSATGATVTLEGDVQRCSPLDAVVVTDAVRGVCEPMTVLPPSQQEQLDQLGANLRATLAGG